VQSEVREEDSPLSLSPKNKSPFHPMINIHSALINLEKDTNTPQNQRRHLMKGRDKFRQQQRVSRQVAEGRLKEIKLKFTLLHGWKTDED
jgi:hypothetical protein